MNQPSRPPSRDQTPFTDSGRRAPIVVAGALIALILVIGFIGGRGGSAADSTDTAVVPGSIEALTAIDITTTTTVITDVVAPLAEPTLPPVTRVLSQGLSGEDVQMVQQRLADLGFDPGPVDGIYGLQTKQSVWAFETLVLATPRLDASGTMTPDSWDRLRAPDLVISPRRPTNGQADHTEVYLPEQALIVFHKDVPVLITHISSGQINPDGSPREYCEKVTYDTDAQGRELAEPVTKEVCALAKTPGGVFTYKRMVEGKRVSPLGGMWNPVYFNYGIAVHGAENVPNEPDSHGCVRLPMHISNYFQDKVSVGDRILVWNGDKEPEQVSERESLPSFDYADPNATTTTTTTTTTVPVTTTTTPKPVPAPVPTTTATPVVTTVAPTTTTVPVTTTTTDVPV